jgi:AcrR family transcriptional regulator
VITQDGSMIPHTQLSRNHILHATAVCLRRDGYDADTIRRIAGELSCSVGSIYRYFQDKRELLFTVAQLALEPVAQLAESGGDLAASIRGYHAAAAGDPSLYRLMFWLAAMDGRRAELADANGEGSPAPTPAPVPVSIAPLPPVVERIIAAWTLPLRDAGAAKRCWIILHGGLMLGLDAGACLAMVRASVPEVHRVFSTIEPMAAVEQAESPRAAAVEQWPHITVVPSAPAADIHPVIHVREALVPALAGSGAAAEPCPV